MKNRVRQFRESLNLTQRKLAEMVGTSQQQIQRIESGNIAAKLTLAVKLSAVLKKPLDIIFPGAAKAIKEAEHRGDIEQYPAEDAWEKLRKSGIEADPTNWTIKVLLRGHKEPMVFEISASDMSRLHRDIQEEHPDDGSIPFTVFDTKDRCIAVNLNELSCCHFLCDSNEIKSETIENLLEVKIYLCGREEPLAIEVGADDDPTDEEDNGQCRGIFHGLENYVDGSARFCLSDADGEEAFIKFDDLALLSVPLYVIDPPILDDEVDNS